MTRSREDFDLVAKLEERGYSRDQVTIVLDITDAMVSVARRGSTLVKKLLRLRRESGR